MSTHFENLHRGIDRAIAPIEPEGQLHEYVSDTAAIIQGAGGEVKTLREEMAAIGDKAIELVGVTFPERAVASNTRAGDVIEWSFDALRNVLQGTYDGRALKGLEHIGAARQANQAIGENIRIGGQELAQQIQVKLGELLALMDVVADQGLRTTILDQDSLLRMAENGYAPSFQAVAGPINTGVTLIREFQQSIS